jgi:hypothetical protein
MTPESNALAKNWTQIRSFPGLGKLLDRGGEESGFDAECLWNPATNQDRQDRITNFVGQPETKAFGGDYTALPSVTVVCW